MSCQMFVSITEQPAAKQQRFRYLSEVDGARSVGSIPGVNSTSDRKTFPSIHVHGYNGPFIVLLSLLNPDNNLIHPHSITGSDLRYKCRNGVIFVISEEPDVVFKNIGILCVKGKTEKDVKSALKMRKQMGVDPFSAGFPHMYDHSRINFTAVRLCFQVFLPAQDWTPADRNNLNKYTRPLPVVVSQVIYDAKKLNELKIVHINSCAGSTSGGNEMTILCDKYTGLNPDVVFDDERGWTQAASVKIYHKQLAIVFEAPPYPVHRDGDNLKVKVYLQQTSERGTERSPSATVEYLPSDPKGSPKFPSPPQSEKSSISLKQVRIQQRPCPGGPEDGRLKRWRPWGRGGAPPDPSTTDSEEDHISSDHISQIIIRELKNTAPGRTDIDERCEVIPLFDPNNPELQAHEWISTIDQLGNEYNWSDAVRAYYMQKRLTGLGKHWLSTLRHSDSWTWSQWKEKLLEAFHRKVDYVDLLKEMLAQRITKSERVRYYNKNPLPARHEINAKKAYACLIEGWPLQMKTTYYGHHEPRQLLRPNYTNRLDREDLQNNAPQIHPINLNKDEHMNDMDEQEDVKPIFPNIVNYRFDANGHDDHGRFCCCNEEKARVIRPCPPSKLNEMRPSCIIQRNQRPLEKSWHQPCSTLTSSSSSPSIANPAPGWFMHQGLKTGAIFLDVAKAFDKVWQTKLYLLGIPDRLVPTHHTRLSQGTKLSLPTRGNAIGPTLYSLFTNDIPRHPKVQLGLFADDTALFTTHSASYPANILTKGKSSAKRRPNNSSSQAQTYGVNHDFKMSPSSYQEFSPPVNTPELGYNGLNFLPSTSWKVNSIDGNNMAPEINTNDNINPHVVNDNSINSLPSTSGLKYRFCTKMPAGTKVKREQGGPDSEELPSKRDKLMSIDFEDLLRDVPPTYIHPNPFIETNRPPPIQNVVSPPAAGLPVGRECVDEYDPLCTDEVVKLILDVLGPEGVPGLTNMVAAGDEWHRQRVNIPNVNQPIQHDHANLQHNVAQPGIFNNVDQSLPDYHINIDLQHNVGHAMLMRGNQASNHIENVSKELSKMNVQDK